MSKDTKLNNGKLYAIIKKTLKKNITINMLYGHTDFLIMIIDLFRFQNFTQLLQELSIGHFYFNMPKLTIGAINYRPILTMESFALRKGIFEYLNQPNLI